VDVTGLVDEEIATAFAAAGMPALVPGPDLIATMRAQPPFIWRRPPPEGVQRDLVMVPGAPGDPEVAVRIARPTAPRGPVPAHLWIHGGGYILGTHEADVPRLDQLVSTFGCVAASVEYRLAPETPYPGPLEDCFAALRHLVDHAEDLGIDPTRVTIGGASAGGGLAAGLALLARDRGIALVHQHLIYPMLDDRLSTPSSGWTVPVWTREMNDFGWRAYLGTLFGTSDVPPYAAASRATDLAGLPPAFVHVGTLDGFLHEDIDYAQRLLAAGVSTELHVYPGAPHGFDSLAAGTSLGRRANEIADHALARVLTP
jgi:acetyl esterase/lipase